MNFTRREFVTTALAAAGGAAIGRRAFGAGRRPARAETYFDWKKAADGAHVAFGEGGNALVVLAEDGALLVDCKNAPFGQALRREATGLGAKLSLVVNTHHHADHTAGNTAFTHDLIVTAHEKARPRVLAQTERYLGMIKNGVATVAKSTKPAAPQVLEDAKALGERVASIRPEDFAPTRTVGDHEELEVGGLTVVLHHFGPGHTDNDLAVHLPRLNVIHAGDLLFNRMYPFWDADGGVSGPGWIKALEGVRELCDARTVVVPGHGELTDRAGVQGAIDVHQKIRDLAAAAVEAKVPRDEFIKTNLVEFAEFGLTMAKPRVFGGWYDEASRSGG